MLLFLAVIISTFNLEAQQNEKNIHDYQNEIFSWLCEYNVPAVGIGIIKEGKLSECRVLGELRKGNPANDSAIFSIASVTKTIVTMVTLKLVETKQWDLDEPLYKYWIDPDITDDERYKKLTTRYVLNHKSGFPNWRSDTQSKKLEFLFEPGEKYSYSGEGFEYLKKALEQKFNKSLEELSDSILFTPLGMKSTKYHWGEKIDESRFAYKHNNEGKVYEEEIQKYASAAYGLLTTVEDYSKFGIDVINRAGLSDDLFNEMVSTQINIKKNIDQGLGWQIIRNLPNGEYALMHEGGSNGVSTLVVLLPISKRGIVIFTNSDNGDKVYLKVLETFIDVGNTIKRDLLQMSYDPNEIKTIEISNEILSTYAGSYFIPSFQMTVKIIYEGNSLKIETPYTKMMLYAESETKFFAKDDDLKIEFVKDGYKMTTGFKITIRGAEPEYSKKIQ
jgi:CubicO group peptidase (beta-lactamase class C family)